MQKMRSKQLMLNKLFLIGIPVVGVFFFIILKYFSVFIVRWFPECVFYRLFHLYCPACGNTRSVLAFLRGDIISSLRFNVTPAVLIMVSAFYYLDKVSDMWGNGRRLFPRNNIFWIVMLVLLLCYYIFRNFVPYLTP